MLDIPYAEYYKYTLDALDMTNFLVGLFHGLVFGVVISLCGCYFGINCGRNADSVGKATTQAVVTAIVWMIVMTGIITFIIKSPKYTLDIKGKKLKVGDSLEKVKELPGFTSMQEMFGVYTIYFNNMMTDESIRIISSKDGLIECINIEPRYY